MKEKFYITTAIAYTSAKPHIGNTYEIVLADSIARYKRLKGFDVYFQTGTDDHGQKIETRAQEEGLNPEDYIEKIGAEIKSVWDVVNTSYDKFVRTEDKKHKEVVQKIFKRLYDQGDIYLGEYEGYYCVPCESFFTEKQLTEGKCPDCGREVKLEKEQTYFLKLSKYQKQLEEYYENNPDFIVPESRKKEMLNNFIKPGLQDLSVSRTSFKWGVEVDFDSKHVIYVWIDALANYITNIGYDPDGSSEDFNKLWPADLQIIGKDIVRFHVIYWPILLMALGLPLPKKIYGHPWLLTNNEKMSKSKGNVIYADDLVERFGIDAIRYYLLHEVSFANDGTISYDLIIERVNSDLVNTLGNLVNRTISMGHKYFDGVVANKKSTETVDKELIDQVNNLDSLVANEIENLEIGNSIEKILELFRRSNKYVDETTPWVLAKDETKSERLETVIYNLLEAIRVAAVLIEPFMPDTSDKILNQLNTEDKDVFFKEDNQYNLNNPEILFQRIDSEQFFKENE